MPGVMVDELGLGFDSTISSPMFENLMACPSPNAASRALKFFGSDTNSDKFLSGNVPANLNPMMGNFSGLNLYNVISSSPQRGSPRMLDTDGRENIGSKLFSRSLSKFSGNGMTEDMMLRGEAYDEEGVPSENGGDNNVFHALSVADFKDPVNNGAPFPIGAAFDNSGSFVGSPVLSDPIIALQKFLPSNNEDGDVWPSMDFYSCDEFRMYEFKVRRCMRGRSHDWTECPFAHPGEKARRRDPRRFHYSGAACPDFRKGSCRRGDACEFAHGVFECWLHPARYRTQPCKDGRNCKRRVCFFAHTPEQLRLLPASAQAAATSASRSSFYSPAKSPLSGSYDGSLVRSLMSGSYDGSPLRQALAGSLDSQLLDNWPGLVHSDGTCDGHPGSPSANPSSMLCKSGFGYPSLHISSPTSTLAGHSHSPPMLSPPLSPSGSPPLTPDSPNNLSRPSFARCLSGSFQTSLPQTAISQIQGSVSPFLSNSSPMLASPASTHGLSPLSPTIPSHRRHLDRLHSLPSISVPNFDARDGYSMNSPGADSFDKMHSSQAVNELVATLQNLQLRARAAEANIVSPSSWSLMPSTFSTVSHSLPGSPLKSRWVGQTDSWDTFCEVEPAPQRVESGRDLRAKIYAKLSKENPLESESPDLGWVNELVK